MPAAGRTYWLTEPCRIRREDNTVRVERPDGTPVRLPITDIRDLVTFDHVDINTSALSLLNQHGVTIHVLDHYGNHAGHFTPAHSMASASVIRQQVELTANPTHRATIGRALVLATAQNVQWALETEVLEQPLTTLRTALPDCHSSDDLMGQEGNFRRTSWTLLDTHLPAWLRLDGRTRRPPTNAGNAFVSYLNSLVYARMLTALRTTPLHTAIGFLHADTDRRRNTLALDLAEPFKPLFAERLLKRAASQKTLKNSDFETDVGKASLSKEGRKKVSSMMKTELAATVYHRTLKRKVSYEELMHLEALKIVRLCLEGKPYKPFRPWW